MAGDTEVNIDINVEDNSSTDIEYITNNVVHLHQAVQREEKQNDRWSASVKRMAAGALTAARAVGKVASSVAAVAAMSGPATSGLLAAAKAAAAFGRGVGSLTVLAAFIPSLIGSLQLVTRTLKLAGPGLAVALEPVTRFFVDADGNASAFTKRLQTLVGVGVRPLAQEFVRVNLPFIASAMERITVATNGTVVATGRWVNSAEGQKVVKTIADATAASYEKLSPKITAAAIAMGRLAGRAGGRAITGLADLIGRIVDKFTLWADTKDIDDINAALEDLSGFGKKIGNTFEVVRDIGRWMGENEGRVKAFSDAVAVGAIAIGAATGNIPAVIGGAFALIVNHWDDLKARFSGAGPWMSSLVERWQHDAGRIRIAAAIMDALRTLRGAFQEATKDIGPKWAEFVRQIKGAWEEWAPLIATWWETSGRQVFEFVGAALGTFVSNLVVAAAAATWFAKEVAAGFKTMVRVILDVLGGIIVGAAKAFGWMPGIGPKLQAAAAEFEAFKNAVNRALNGIEPIKTIRINAAVYVTGGGNVAGGVDQRTGNSQNAGLSGLTSWQRVAAEFAAVTSGTSRTGGPAPVTATVRNTVLLDGRPFRAYADRVVLESERRTAWRLRVGTR